MGGTGDPPVPVGDSPTGRGETPPGILAVKRRDLTAAHFVRRVAGRYRPVTGATHYRISTPARQAGSPDSAPARQLIRFLSRPVLTAGGQPYIPWVLGVIYLPNQNFNNIALL